MVKLLDSNVKRGIVSTAVVDVRQTDQRFSRCSYASKSVGGLYAGIGSGSG